MCRFVRSGGTFQTIKRHGRQFLPALAQKFQPYHCSRLPLGDLIPQLRAACDYDVVEEVEPGTAADEAGIQEGDIIVAADRKAVGTASALAEIIRGHTRDTPMLLQIRRGSSALFVALG